MNEIVWFRTADSYLGIFGWTDLAEDARVEDARRGARSHATEMSTSSPTARAVAGETVVIRDKRAQIRP